MVEGCEETRVLGRNVRANAVSKVLDAVGGVKKVRKQYVCGRGILNEL